MLKGWRTIAFNAGLAGLTAALNALAGVDWISAVGETWAAVIIAGVNIALRIVTDTPVGRKDPEDW